MRYLDTSSAGSGTVATKSCLRWQATLTKGEAEAYNSFVLLCVEDGLLPGVDAPHREEDCGVSDEPTLL